MKKLESFGTIQDGKLHLIHADKFKQNITTLPNGRYRFTLEKVYRKRSNSQNAFYFGVVVTLIMEGLKDAGFENFDKDKTHDLIKYKFLKVEEVSTNGEVIETIKSTTSLTTTEFMSLLADIKSWALEFLNVDIPEPGQEMEIKFENNESK